MSPTPLTAPAYPAADPGGACFGTCTIAGCCAPRRVQRQRTAGWRKPPGSVVVTRPGRFGNPFTVPMLLASDVEDSDTPEKARALAVAVFSVWVAGLHVPESVPQPARDVRRRLLAAVPELRGKTLVCWCAEDGPCHADVLFALANPPQKGNTP